MHHVSVQFQIRILSEHARESIPCRSCRLILVSLSHCYPRCEVADVLPCSRERRREPREAHYVLASHFARRLPVVHREAHRDLLLEREIPYKYSSAECRWAGSWESDGLDVDVGVRAGSGVGYRGGRAR